MPVTHVVQQGECLSRIAARYGFASHTDIYDHPANAEFKRKRPNPNIIHPGDEVVIPDKAPKSFAVATGAVHRFVVQLPRRTLRLSLQDADRAPLADTPCTLTISGKAIKGVTDGQGILVLEVPVDAEEGRLVAGSYEWPLRIAALNPIDHTDDGGISGIQGRLRNMGHDPGPVDGQLGSKTRAALRAFQARNNLTINGEPDESTRAKLMEHHGC